MTDGSTDSRFAGVRAAFDSVFSDGLERGAAVAVWVDGQAVVDLWGGHRDLVKAHPWQHDTLVNVWSVSEGVAAVAVAMLVEHGLVDCAAPVARYWPEFAANGKQSITLDQVLTHQAGLDGLSVPMSDADFLAGAPFVQALAEMAPLWQPGSRCVYHPFTCGHIIGELVRRIDGRSFAQFVAQEIAAPLGLCYFVGLP